MRLVKDHPGWVPATFFFILSVLACLLGGRPWWVGPLVGLVWVIPVLFTCWERES